MAGRIKGQGMNWLALPRRMAIYARDGHACAFCNTRGGPHGFGLSVDHLTASHRGGQNSNVNLITCCGRCNSQKRDITLKEFVEGPLRARGHDPAEVMRRVASMRRRSIDRELGHKLADARENRVVPPPFHELQAVAKRRVEENKRREARAVARMERQAQAKEHTPQSVQTGKKGGRYVTTSSGKRRYIGHSGKG